MRFSRLISRKIARTLLAACALVVATGVSAADIEKGKAKSSSCVGCHGVNGISAIPTFPNLAGQKAAYTAAQLKAFKDGTRKNATMASMVLQLTDQDMADIAAYYESLKP